MILQSRQLKENYSFTNVLHRTLSKIRIKKTKSQNIMRPFQQCDLSINQTEFFTVFVYKLYK